MTKFYLTTEIKKTITSDMKEYNLSYKDCLEVEKKCFYKKIIEDALENVQITQNMRRVFGSKVNAENKDLMNDIYTLVKGTYAASIISTVAKGCKIFTEKQVDVIAGQLAI